MKTIAIWLMAMLLACHALAQSLEIGPTPYDALTLPGAKTAGRALAPGSGVALTAAAVGAANRLYAMPLWIGNPSLAKTLSFNITVGNAAAWNAEMCLYADSGSGVPGGLLADSGQISVGSGSVTGVQTSPTLNSGSGVVLQGWVWVAFMASSASETLSSMGNNPMFTYQLLGSTVANAFIINYTTGVFAAQTFGTCPATFPAISYNTAASTPAVVVGF